MGNKQKKQLTTGSETLSKPEMVSAEKLYDYLILNLPKSIDFRDLYNLCFSLFCTLDVLPKNLRHLRITKSVLVLTFMKITEIKNISEYINETDWGEKIDSFLKLENNYPNHEKARLLIGTN